MSTDPGDAELVDVRLPERIDVPALEPPEGLGLADDPNQEAVALQDPMDRARADGDPSPLKESVDAEGAPRRMLTPEDEDPVDEVPVGPVGIVEGTAGLIPEPSHSFFSIISAPTP
jgi:hypothetical protein